MNKERITAAIAADSLAQVRRDPAEALELVRELLATAWDEGCKAGRYGFRRGGGSLWEGPPRNPYREAE